MQAYGGTMVPQNPPVPPLTASDTINIPHGPEVNFLIGRGGATISQLEQECQCKIAIQKAAEMLPGSTTRIVTITGADAAKRARAASLIHAKVGEYRVSGTAAGGLPPPTGASSAPSYVPLAPSAPTLAAEGEVTVIHVPNGPEVNFIIGKGGGTINEIQRESGCHIAIQKVSEVERGAATRLVTIFGADSGQRARCVELVLAKVAEYTASGAAVVNSSGGAGGGESLPSNTLVIEIPNGPEVNYVIGPRGGTIGQIESSAGVKIAVQRAEEARGAPMRAVSITGADEDARGRAAELVKAKVAEHQSGGAGKPTADGGPRQAGAPPPIPPAAYAGGAQRTTEIPNGPEVNFIIGKGGATIRELEERSGCRINVQRASEVPPGTITRMITVSGPSDGAVANAIRCVHDKLLEYAPTGGAAPGGGGGGGAAASTVVLVPNGGEVNFLIGRGGQTIHDLENQSGCKIVVQKASEVAPGAPAREVTILSPDAQRRDLCASLVLAKVAEYSAGVDGSSDHAAKRMRSSHGGYAMPPTYGGAPVYPPHGASAPEPPQYYGGVPLPPGYAQAPAYSYAAQPPHSGAYGAPPMGSWDPGPGGWGGYAPQADYSSQGGAYNPLPPPPYPPPPHAPPSSQPP